MFFSYRQKRTTKRNGAPFADKAGRTKGKKGAEKNLFETFKNPGGGVHINCKRNAEPARAAELTRKNRQQGVK